MTPHMAYAGNDLGLEGVRLSDLAARYGTPLYVYSHSEMEDRYRAFKLPDRENRLTVCFSVKANPNPAILRTFFDLGAGFDVTSAGELFLAGRAAQAAGNSRTPAIVFSGAGKSSAEIEMALKDGITMLNLESGAEMERVAGIAARLGVRAPVSFRVNPDVDPKTHPYIATGLRKHKFGVPWKECLALYEAARQRPELEVVGVSCHIGSQMLSIRPVTDAVRRILRLADDLRRSGFTLRYIDVGGGLGIRYHREHPPSPEQYAARLLGLTRRSSLHVIAEPGRSLVGNAGLLLTRVLDRKTNRARRFVIVDAAMTDLIRPTLYGAYHEILPVRLAARGRERVDVVGPVCESGDYLALNRQLPRANEGDLLAVLSSGAYGYAMASNYNGRLRPAEVMVNRGEVELIRPRERLEDLLPFPPDPAR
ncbi:MAG: diaminopimelate decarboxylase [Nitrospirae bacterium]|nr:diaminopimelate decarboxylase [Nitrospirota bacterium]